MRIAGFAGILVVAGSVAAGASENRAPAAPPHPIAVELFTSQGCSSCPPADVVLGKLAAQSDVVAISRPVTYWDSLGWKDSLARPANTALQRAYAARKIAGAGVYTPQIVVQGRTGFVGSNEGPIRGEIVRLSRMPEPGLAIAATADGGRSVRVSGTAKDARLMLIAVRRMTVVRIGRGENGGRELRYANALVRETAIGQWRGGAASFAVPAAALKVAGADRYVLLVREGAAGPILAARYL
jgi:hypothetical protein